MDALVSDFNFTKHAFGLEVACMVNEISNTAYEFVGTKSANYKIAFFINCKWPMIQPVKLLHQIDCCQLTHCCIGHSVYMYFQTRFAINWLWIAYLIMTIYTIQCGFFFQYPKIWTSNQLGHQVFIYAISVI